MKRCVNCTTWIKTTNFSRGLPQVTCGRCESRVQSRKVLRAEPTRNAAFNRNMIRKGRAQGRCE